MNNNRCVCCGEIIPGGTQICWKCQKESDKVQYIELETFIQNCYKTILKENNDGAKK